MSIPEPDPHRIEPNGEIRQPYIICSFVSPRQVMEDAFNTTEERDCIIGHLSACKHCQKKLAGYAGYN